MKFKKLILIPVTLLCSCTCGDFKQYVLADRLFFDVQKEHYSKLVEKEEMTEMEKQIHLRRIEAKEQQLQAAEQLLGLKK
jgi:hypothetical protein